jgi:hypothetical protein
VDTRSIATPIFVIEPGDVNVSLELEEALASVEAIDVIDGTVGMWDASGARLQLKADSYSNPVRLGSVGPNEHVWLRARLADFMRRAGPERYGLRDPNWDTLTLEDLVSALEKREREWRASRLSFGRGVLAPLRSLRR